MGEAQGSSQDGLAAMGWLLVVAGEDPADVLNESTPPAAEKLQELLASGGDASLWVNSVIEQRDECS